MFSAIILSNAFSAPFLSPLLLGPLQCECEHACCCLGGSLNCPRLRDAFSPLFRLGGPRDCLPGHLCVLLCQLVCSWLSAVWFPFPRLLLLWLVLFFVFSNSLLKFCVPKFSPQAWSVFLWTVALNFLPGELLLVFLRGLSPPGVSSCSLIWNMVLCRLSCLASSVCLYEVMQICAGFEGMSSCGGS